MIVGPLNTCSDWAKSKPCFFKVGLALGFSPREVHRADYTYDDIYYKMPDKPGWSLTN